MDSSRWEDCSAARERGMLVISVQCVAINLYLNLIGLF